MSHKSKYAVSSIAKKYLLFSVRNAIVFLGTGIKLAEYRSLDLKKKGKKNPASLSRGKKVFFLKKERAANFNLWSSKRY